MSLASRLAEELERDEAARRRIARLIASEIAGEGSLRVLILDALLREAATKADIESLERRLEERIDSVEERLEREMEVRIRSLEERLQREIDRVWMEVSQLRRDLNSLFKWVIGLLASIWLTLVALLLPVVLRLLYPPG